jgi:hypothetical protein
MGDKSIGKAQENGTEADPRHHRPQASLRNSGRMRLVKLAVSITPAAKPSIPSKTRPEGRGQTNTKRAPKALRAVMIRPPISPKSQDGKDSSQTSINCRSLANASFRNYNRASNFGLFAFGLCLLAQGEVWGFEGDRPGHGFPPSRLSESGRSPSFPGNLKVLYAGLPRSHSGRKNFHHCLRNREAYFPKAR